MHDIINRIYNIGQQIGCDCTIKATQALSLRHRFNNINNGHLSRVITGLNEITFESELTTNKINNKLSMTHDFLISSSACNLSCSWILLDGTWNDLGLWKDVATWND